MKAGEDEWPSAEDLAVDDEPRFLRRSKAVAVRRGRVSRRMRRAALGGLLVALALVPVSYAGYRIARFALNSPLFELHSPADVLVAGNHYVSCAEILEAMDLSVSRGAGEPAHGANLCRLSLSAERDALESVPWIRSATVTRALPGRLAVFVVERSPVAYAEVDNGVRLVDGDGVLLDMPQKASFDFPVIQGLTDGQTPLERKERLQRYLQFMQETANEFSTSGWAVSQVDLSDTADLKTLVVQGGRTILLHFGQEQFLERLQKFVTLLPELDKEDAKIDSVDLRYRNEVVVNPAESEAGDADSAKTPPPAKPSKN